MDPIEQNSQPTYQQPMTPTSAPTAVLKKHFSTLWILLPLIILAGALFLFVGATKPVSTNDDTAIPLDDTSMINDQAAAGETPGATVQESAAIRADLEANNTDGVSDGI